MTGFRPEDDTPPDVPFLDDMEDDGRDFAPGLGPITGRAPRERLASERSRANDDTRHQERDPLDMYAPPQQLETPQDEHYEYRWVTEFVNGFALPRSVQIRIREGYERVRMDSLPEDFIVDEDARGDGYARTGGLILMRVDKRRLRARSRYFRNQSISRLDAADELQGVAGRDAVREDRGSRSIIGEEARRVLNEMSRS